MGKITRAIKYAIKTRINPKPRFIEFDITKYCNSKCKYCNIWKGEKPGRDMTLGEIKQAFSDPILKDVEYIVVTGGEPTLRHDLGKIYDILHESCPKATLQLSTNALLPMTAYNVVKHCLDKGMKIDVGISLDGIGEAHDLIRGKPGNFLCVDSLRESLKDLQSDYPEQLGICLGMTISNLTTPKNYEMIKTYAKVHNLPLEYAWVEQTPYYDNDYLNLSKKRTELIVKDLPDSKRKEDWLKDIKGEDISFDCYALRTFFVLRYDGSIAPCLHYYDKTIGNVKYRPISEILKDIPAEECKKNIIKPCKGCLNTWAYSESHMAKLTPYIKYYLRNIGALKKELRK